MWLKYFSWKYFCLDSALSGHKEKNILPMEHCTKLQIPLLDEFCLLKWRNHIHTFEKPQRDWYPMQGCVEIDMIPCQYFYHFLFCHCNRHRPRIHILTTLFTVLFFFFPSQWLTGTGMIVWCISLGSRRTFGNIENILYLDSSRWCHKVYICQN